MKALELLRGITLVFILVSVVGGCSRDRSSIQPEWPPVTRECRPWTYWWWHGSAVDKANITANLEDLSDAGMGGVHIIPIYGVRGCEDRYIRYLSPEWMEMLEYTVREAKRLDMGVDMTTGTGWPFGGPHVAPEDAASLVRVETITASGNDRLHRSFPAGRILAAAAYKKDSMILDISDAVDPETGSISWTAPEGEWTVYVVLIEPTGQRVKRAAPGGEGNVMDYFSTGSLMNYLARFDSSFAGYRAGPVRAFYNDSFEVYGSNWTHDFFDEFRVRRGYDLKRYLPEFLGDGGDDTVARVRHDYNETISDLVLERFTMPWVRWCHEKGGRTRNQAHGSPGNLLDLYAAADIPETEAFGPSGFPIPGLRIDGNIPGHFGKPDVLVEKFASSAAHVTGKPLVSSESCTWLGEHFQVSLSQIKPEIDALFVAGVNHVFFHGTAYSPKGFPWPGWLFYASTNFGPTGSFWRDLPSLNSYITRCQSFLQSGTPDNDVLLYWPVHDTWRGETDEDRLHHFQVHNAGEWLYGTPFHEAAKIMWERGFQFDYISDRQVLNAEAAGAGIETGGGTYRVLVVPGCRYMPAGTFEKIVSLARSGATVVVVGSLPSDVPGLGNLRRERGRLRELKESVKFVRSVDGIDIAPMGRGRILVGDDIEKMLVLAGVGREQVVDSGVECIRRKYDGGRIYFFTNLGDRRLDDWVALGTRAESALIYDPLTHTCGSAALKTGRDGFPLVYLQMDPGESRVIKTFVETELRAEPWSYLREMGKPCEISGTWHVEFLEGGPETPGEFSTDRLASWTELGDEKAGRFHGSARYTIQLERPETDADEWVLDLGRVCESARVWVNGDYIGTLFSLPFRARVGKSLKDGTNILEVEVTNLAANRIADMDRRGIDWKIFNDINFVSIRYEKFDASSWAPVDSGLLGPVRLVPCSAMTDKLF